ncbi:hypothetical protein [Caulobacter sp. S45]|uniref:hypothetical protein n=1 Tax=Caulobacter sp. S45 TaxID=1641861 RepID=UPI00131E17DD|nr:hypothetical protein [Caulobacter sp. S45]
MADLALIAAQDSAHAAWAAIGWSRASFWGSVIVGLLSIGVNGVLAWLAFDGPRKQREADHELARQTFAHEAGKIVNLQLGGLNVCKAVYLAADDALALTVNVTNQNASALRAKRPDLAIQIRLLDYFLSKDIADVAVVHAMMKTRDGAVNLQSALDFPGLQGGATQAAFQDIARVISHVLDQCSTERGRVEERIAAGSAFIDSLTS